MNNQPGKIKLELLWVIVNVGLGSKILKSAKQNGVSGGTVLFGKGTVHNRILELLDLYEIKKEIVLIISEKSKIGDVVEILNNKFHFNKPNHGIAFSISVNKLFGARNYSHKDIDESRGGEKTMYNAIFVVVDKGNAEDVVEVANKAGSRGGTIIKARGSGIHETSKLFSMDIEPEKEIVLILSESSLTGSIASAIREELKIDQPGNGIIFIQDVNQTYGLY